MAANAVQKYDRLMIVTIHSGTNLKGKNMDGTSDPYCEVIFTGMEKEIEPDKLQTSTIERNCNPTWNQSFAMFVSPKFNNQFIIHCHDKGMLVDSNLGKTHVVIPKGTMCVSMVNGVLDVQGHITYSVFIVPWVVAAGIASSFSVPAGFALNLAPPFTRLLVTTVGNAQVKGTGLFGKADPFLTLKNFKGVSFFEKIEGPHRKDTLHPLFNEMYFTLIGSDTKSYEIEITDNGMMKADLGSIVVPLDERQFKGKHALTPQGFIAVDSCVAPLTAIAAACLGLAPYVHVDTEEIPPGAGWFTAVTFVAVEDGWSVEIEAFADGVEVAFAELRELTSRTLHRVDVPLNPSVMLRAGVDVLLKATLKDRAGAKVLVDVDSTPVGDRSKHSCVVTLSEAAVALLVDNVEEKERKAEAARLAAARAAEMEALEARRREEELAAAVARRQAAEREAAAAAASAAAEAERAKAAEALRLAQEEHARIQAAAAQARLKAEEDARAAAAAAAAREAALAELRRIEAEKAERMRVSHCFKFVTKPGCDSYASCDGVYLVAPEAGALHGCNVFVKDGRPNRFLAFNGSVWVITDLCYLNDLVRDQAVGFGGFHSSTGAGKHHGFPDGTTWAKYDVARVGGVAPPEGVPHVLAEGSWVVAAPEHGSFTVPPNSRVRYGATGRYCHERILGGTFTANNALFGDPAPGVPKQAEVFKGGPWRVAAEEGGVVVVPSNTKLRYGANGVYSAEKVLSGTVRINDDTFGDPLPGVFKHAEVFGAGPCWKVVAAEGHSATVPPNTRVRYGVDGRYSIEHVISGEFRADNGRFGDPAPGFPKNAEMLV